METMDVVEGMSLSQAIAERTSVRDYRDEPVPAHTVRQLLAAAVRAPTAMHQEKLAFVIVQDIKLLAMISDIAKPLFLEELRRKGDAAPPLLLESKANLFYNASTLIVICAPQRAAFAHADCWLAAESLLLASYAQGLGTCVIGSAVAGLNHAVVRRELDIPDDYEAIAPMVVGVPRETHRPSPRKEPRVLCWRKLERSAAARP